MSPAAIQRVRVAFAILAGVFFCYQAVTMTARQRNNGYGASDLQVFYAAATIITQQTNLAPIEIYEADQFRPAVKAVSQYRGGTKFLYPPQAAILFAPISFIPFQTLITLWLWMNALVFVAAYYTAIWFFVGKSHIWDARYSILLALLSFAPAIFGLLKRGQVDGVVWLLLLFSIIGLYKKSGTAAACCWRC